MLFLALELKIDASSDTLILEKDKDLRYFQVLNKRYNSPDFLIIAYTPKNKLLSQNVKNDIKDISNALEKLEKVDSVISILNVPLLESSNKNLADILTGIPTLEDGIVDEKSVIKELTTSYLYKNNLVSENFKTTAILINLNVNKKLVNLRDKKQEYFEIIENRKLEEKELDAYKGILDLLSYERDKERNSQKELVSNVRDIINNYKGTGDIYLGGIPMIANDVVAFVKNDLKVFGVSILVFLIITLAIIFRQSRWIIMPIITCFFSVIITAGIFSIFNWEVTVISSNFISLQLILTMAITIHLIVRYRELALKNIYTDQEYLLSETIKQMIKPCFFTVITTIAGFSSLILSGLLPVINFGWMMSVGVVISLILTFIMFPALMKEFKILLPNTKFENFFNLPQLVAELTINNKNLILIIAISLMAFSVIGISKLKVENSFINYFKSNTEIYKGMKVIDENLGGTTLLDVTIDFKDNKKPEETDNEEIEEEGDDFDEVFADISSESNDPKYWFTKDKMNKIEKTHDYLDSLDETGKVLSFATILKIGRNLNNGQDLDSVQLALLYEKLPEEYKDAILNPYISTKHNQARITLRVKDSEPTLRRNDLINKIKKELPQAVGIDNTQVRLSNILILYNNMLQSLFNSQIMTLGLVIMALFVMFLILFRSIKISLIALIPNLLSIGSVLGLMGILRIPLDMMTITIAAISMGIAVDNTIHYIFRHKKEYLINYSYDKAMKKTHNSIGYALYYTTLTIIVGFSILVFSNFIPSIYFGLLTSLAMIVALLASLTLVPRLLAILKPYPKKN
ncbi:MMPL family transporter [Alphaproteobacteria bacterium]|nr:MMPL family transporter [Alphaproteobacteria bacterium]